jgi:hypothetical protein
MLNLTIKGGRETAEREAAKRNITALFVTVHHSEYSTWTILQAKQEEEKKVAEWFCEEGNAPYPNGTLLFYKGEEREEW